MFQKSLKMQLVVLALILLQQMNMVLSYKQNYEAKYTKANVPLWKQRACEKAQKNRANSHYICDDMGDVKCLPGWQGDLCQVPMCRKGCDPMNGYCQRPGECRCRIGYTGELCDKCIPLPGCQHGDCTKPFECICRSGWDGLFCTEPTCRQGCHNTRGYCESPGECRCRIGWAGRNCSDCSVLPGCQHGTCIKPLDCHCLPGYTGLLCQTPICNADCHKQRGYCKRPGECRCKVGWTGINCDKCFPYPGCVNGDCEKPWECNCKPGWGGMLCDEKLTYCKENPHICENGGKCISLAKEDGSYRCHCKQGFLGQNCEILDEFLRTSTTPPRITPPHPDPWDQDEEDEDSSAALINDNELQSSSSSKEMLNELDNTTRNVAEEQLTGPKAGNVTNTRDGSNETLHLLISNSLVNVKNLNNRKHLENSNLKLNDESNSTENNIFGNMTPEATASPIMTPATYALNFLHINETIINSTFSSAATPKTVSTETTIIFSHNTTTISPLSKLDDEKYLLNIPLTQPPTNKKQTEDDNDDDDGDGDGDGEDDDEDCTDDNDDECEYVEDDDDEDDFK